MADVNLDPAAIQGVQTANALNILKPGFEWKSEYLPYVVLALGLIAAVTIPKYLKKRKK